MVDLTNILQGYFTGKVEILRRKPEESVDRLHKSTTKSQQNPIKTMHIFRGYVVCHREPKKTSPFVKHYHTHHKPWSHGRRLGHVKNID